MLRAQGIGSNCSHQCRIHATRKADDSAFKAIFVDVVAGAQHQGLVGLLLHRKLSRNGVFTFAL